VRISTVLSTRHLESEGPSAAEERKRSGACSAAQGCPPVVWSRLGRQRPRQAHVIRDRGLCLLRLYWSRTRSDIPRPRCCTSGVCSNAHLRCVGRITRAMHRGPRPHWPGGMGVRAQRLRRQAGLATELLSLAARHPQLQGLRRWVSTHPQETPSCLSGLGSRKA